MGLLREALEEKRRETERMEEQLRAQRRLNVEAEQLLAENKRLL